MTKDYGTEVVSRVLHGIDLTINRGEFVALVGPSGSGKSTLLNLLGLLDRPTAGELRVLGEDVARLDEGAITRLRGRALGFVFQFHHLLSSLTAAENVMMPLAIQQGGTTRAALDEAHRLLAAVGLAGRADALVSKLSGGQQQRVAIARALVGRPPLVLADEPTGALDSVTADEILRLMRRVHEEVGTAFLIVTHDRKLAAECDRIIELLDGKVVRDHRSHAARD